jgi:molecular chaperone GrpE (heat shock protein)
MSDNELSVLPEPLASPEPAAPALDLQALVERLDRIEGLVTRHDGQLTTLGERLGLIPTQLRELGNKVDNVTENINESRLHDLLLSLLLLLDLTGQFAATANSDHARNYELLRQQMLETLEINGIYPIDASGRFNPAWHKIVERVPCESSEEDGQIASVFRPGFRTERAVLRYAEVVVKFYILPSNGS